MYLFMGCREDGGAEDGSEAGSDDEQADMLAMFDDARKPLLRLLSDNT